MLPLRTSLALLLAFGLSAPLAAAPHLVKDINQGLDTSAWVSSAGWTGPDGTFYFVARDPAHGVELWRTDGSEAGTFRVTDACPGRCDTEPFVGTGVADVGGRIYFNATDGVSGRELWRSDGTPGSEQRVLDLCPGPCSSDPMSPQEIRGALLFVAQAGSERRLLRLEGPAQEPTLLKAVDLNGTREMSGLTKVGERALFLVYDFPQVSLWSSDGTPEGTVLVQGGFGASTWVQGGLVPAGDVAYLWTDDALWRTDGTPAGTARLKSAADFGLTPGFPFSVGRNTVWNGLLVSVIGYGDLVRSDGTPEGTFQIRRLKSSYSLLDPASLSTGLVFVGEEGFSPDTLFRTRGTDATTEKIFQIDGSEGYIGGMARAGDRAVFTIHFFDEQQEMEVWVTDGTAAGTHRLEGPRNVPPYTITSAGDQAFFTAGAELWRTDGTEAGTYEVHDFGSIPGSAGPLSQVVFAGRLLFAPLVDNKAPLFVSDGTPAGTRPLSQAADHAMGFTPVGGRLFFGTPGGLWTTDATPAGTKVVATPIYGFSSPTAFGGQLLFGGADSVPPFFGGPDVELWKSDGRSASRVKNIDPFQEDTGHHHICAPESSRPGPGVVVGDRVIFAAYDGKNGRELWTTDGTRAGTRMLRDIAPAREPLGSDCDNRTGIGVSSSPESLVAFRRGAIFTADDGRTGREIWWTDGTFQGTRHVADLRRGAKGSMPHDLVLFRGAVYFLASTDGNGESLWRTDGTTRGTVLVDDLEVEGTASWAWDLTVSGGQMYFAAYNETTGAELWTSRGDAGSTRLVLDLRPGPDGSSPQDMADAAGVLVFAADDGASGLEPWRSDGTAAGTLPLGDINPGLDASAPGPFLRVGGRVLTWAFDSAHGRELWAIPLEDLLRR